MLSERSLPQKSTYSKIPFIWNSKTGKIIYGGDKIRMVVASGNCLGKVMRNLPGMLVMFYSLIGA